jgi:hypothetical protein
VRERETEIAISILGTLSESEKERKREFTWRWFCLLVFENEVRDKGMHVLSCNFVVKMQGKKREMGEKRECCC